MELSPYYLGLALACIVVSIGLQNRTVWMWYLGWVILYLIAGYLGAIYFPAFFYAKNPGEESFAWLYLLGGLLLWLPAVVWWANHRHLFGRRGKRPASRGTGEPAPKSPDA